MLERFTLARVILFAPDVPATAAFYSRLFGFPVLGDAQDPDFVELEAGGCRLAIHRGQAASGPGRPPKVVLWAQHIGRERDRLLGEGLKVTGLMKGPGFDFCDAIDPAGNVFQISSRP